MDNSRIDAADEFSITCALIAVFRRRLDSRDVVVDCPCEHSGSRHSDHLWGDNRPPLVLDVRLVDAAPRPPYGAVNYHSFAAR
jgi:hypothetical protein